jgi:hypothetical protein
MALVLQEQMLQQQRGRYRDDDKQEFARQLH